MRLMALEKRGLLFDSEFLRKVISTEQVINDSFVFGLDQTLRPFEYGNSVLETDGKSDPVDFSVVQLLFPYCYRLSEDHSNCSECFEGFSLNDEFRCLENAFSNLDDSCADWLNLNECSQCNKGYYLNGDNKCIRLISSIEVVGDSASGVRVSVLNDNLANQMKTNMSNFELPQIDSLPQTDSLNIVNNDKKTESQPVVKENENQPIIDNNIRPTQPSVNDNENIIESKEIIIDNGNMRDSSVPRPSEEDENKFLELMAQRERERRERDKQLQEEREKQLQEEREKELLEQSQNTEKVLINGNEDEDDDKNSLGESIEDELKKLKELNEIRQIEGEKEKQEEVELEKEINETLKDPEVEQAIEEELENEKNQTINQSQIPASNETITEKSEINTNPEPSASSGVPAGTKAAAATATATAAAVAAAVIPLTSNSDNNSPTNLSENQQDSSKTNQPNPIPAETQSTNTKPRGKNPNALDKLLEKINELPEEQIQTENLTIVDESGQSLLFPNNRGYLFRRRYTNKADKDEVNEYTYASLMKDGQILLVREDTSTSPSSVISENISSNCQVVLFLQGQSSTNPIPTCLRCVDQNKFILSQLHPLESQILICRQRLKKIKNCELFSDKTEDCNKCNEGFFLNITNNEQFCLQTLENCQTHIIEQGIIKCTQCSEGSFLRGSICIKQSDPILNCDRQEADQCVICKNGFFKLKNLCIAELAFSFFFCPKDSEGSCICGNDSLKVQEVDECVPIENDNCLRSDSITGECSQCKDKFYLNSNGECREGEIPFCQKYSQERGDPQTCLSCEPSYVLENTICRSSLSFFTDNCKEQLAEDCLQCNDEYYRVELSDYSSLSVCLPNKFFQSYSSVENCLIFNSISQSCELCKEGLWIDEEGKCSVCNFEIEGIDELNTKCIKPSKMIPNCELYNDDLCVKCFDSNLPSILHDDLFTLASRVYTDRAKNQFTVSPSFVINECAVELSDSCSTENCENAIALPFGNTCCHKCKKGRSGIWTQENQVFFTQSCDTVIEFCDSEKSYKGIPMQYFKYLTCQQCIEGKIVQINLTENKPQVECITQPENQPNLTNCLIMLDQSCSLCKPTFISVQSPTGEILCEEISNCEFSETIDECERCASGFVLNENRSSCVPSPIPNCKQIDTDLKCTICNDGLILANGACFELNQPSCLKFDGPNCIQCSPESSELNSLSFENILFKMNLQSLTNKLSDTKKSICVSPKDSDLNPFIENCSVYSSPKFCSKCNAGFIPQIQTENERICIDDPKKTTNCGLISINGSCGQCQDGFYLEGDRCIKGNISGCKTYTDMLNCELCHDEYSLFTRDNRKICFISHSIANCTKTAFLQQDNLVSLNCLSCDSVFKMKQINVANKLCFPLRVKPNCKSFDSNTSLCSQCDDYYFLDASNDCQRRQNLNINKCFSFTPDQDSCQECDEGYILSSDQLSCDLKEIPQSPGCLIQQNSSVKCSICHDEFFLNENSQCESVLSVTPNCLLYLSESQCSRCTRGNVLSPENLCDLNINSIATANLIEIANVSAETEQELPLTAIVSRNLQNELKDKVEDIINPDTSPTQTVIQNIKNLSPDQIAEMKAKLNSINIKEVMSDKDVPQDLTVNVTTPENEDDNVSVIETKNVNVEESGDDNVSVIETKNVNVEESDEESTGVALIKSSKCGLCREEFSYSFISNQCTKNLVEGCLVVSQKKSSPSATCLICRSGYFQSSTGDCLKNLESSSKIIKALIYMLTALTIIFN